MLLLKSCPLCLSQKAPLELSRLVVVALSGGTFEHVCCAYDAATAQTVCCPPGSLCPSIPR